MAKNVSLWSGESSWSSSVTAVDDGWLLELTNEANFPASFFVQWFQLKVPKGTLKGYLKSFLTLLSDNTANPRESILFKLSATPEEMAALKGNHFTIRYGTGYGDIAKHLDIPLP